MKNQAKSATSSTEEAAQFNDGARHGYLLYRRVHQSRNLHPRELYDFLMNILLDTTHPSIWNAGYIAGWFTALNQDGNDVSLEGLAQDASVLLRQLQTDLQGRVPWA